MCIIWKEKYILYMVIVIFYEVDFYGMYYKNKKMMLK